MTQQSQHPRNVEDHLARAITGRLSDATRDLPHSVTERLRAARVQAVAKRKFEPQWTAPVSTVLAGPANIRLGNLDGGWWNRFTSLVALVALVAGLVVIADLQDDIRANELAEIDAELLTDDLPPSAYTDPGFAQYLRSGPER
jgi:hypothetical protein